MAGFENEFPQKDEGTGVFLPLAGGQMDEQAGVTFWKGSDTLLIEYQGATWNNGTYHGMLKTDVLTGDQSWSLPDNTGTLALTSDLSAYFLLTGGELSGDITFSGAQTVDGIDISTIPSTYLALAGGDLTGDLLIEKEGTATSGTTTYDSYDLSFLSSAWDISAPGSADTHTWTMRNVPTSGDDTTSKLSLLHKLNSGSEVGMAHFIYGISGTDVTSELFIDSLPGILPGQRTIDIGGYGNWVELRQDDMDMITQLYAGALNMWTGDTDYGEIDLQTENDGSGAYIDIYNNVGDEVLISQNSIAITNSDSSVIPLTIKGASSQTANLVEWKDSADNLLADISNTGGFDNYGTDCLINMWAGNDDAELYLASTSAETYLYAYGDYAELDLSGSNSTIYLYAQGTTADLYMTNGTFEGNINQDGINMDFGVTGSWVMDNTGKVVATIHQVYSDVVPGYTLINSSGISFSYPLQYSPSLRLSGKAYQRIKNYPYYQTATHTWDLQGQLGTDTGVIDSDSSTLSFIHNADTLNVPVFGLAYTHVDGAYGVTVGSESYPATLSVNGSAIVSGRINSYASEALSNSTITADSFAATDSDSAVWNIVAVNGTTDRLMGSINVMHNSSNTYDSGLYGLVNVGTANADLTITTRINAGNVELRIQNTSMSKSYNVRVQRNIV